MLCGGRVGSAMIIDEDGILSINSWSRISSLQRPRSFLLGLHHDLPLLRTHQCKCRAKDSIRRQNAKRQRANRRADQHHQIQYVRHRSLPFWSGTHLVPTLRPSKIRRTAEKPLSAIVAEETAELALILLTNRIPVEVLQFRERPAARPGTAQRQRIASCFHRV